MAKPMDVSEVKHIEVSMHSEFNTYDCAAGAQEAWTILSMLAPKESKAEERAAIDVTLALDVSGSMSGTKLSLAKSTVQFLINNMESRDRLGLVTYDSNVYVLFPTDFMTPENKTTALGIAANINSGSSTNLCGGMLQAMELLRGSRSKISSVLMMTDGLANQGISSTPAILEAVTAKRASMQEMFSIYTFGFGSDHNAALLRSLSELGQGMYYYIDEPTRIPESIADCFGGLVSVVAQNLSVQLTAHNGAAIRFVHSSIPAVISADGQTAMFRLSDLQAEESRDVPVVLALPATAAASLAPALSCRVQYQNLLTGELTTVDGALTITTGPVAGRGEPLSAVVKHRRRVQCVAAIAQAKQLADSRDFASADRVIAAHLEGLTGAADSFTAELRANLMQCRVTVQDRSSYAREGEQVLSSIGQSHQQQRSNCSAPSRTAYATSTKRFWQSQSPQSSQVQVQPQPQPQTMAQQLPPQYGQQPPMYFPQYFPHASQVLPPQQQPPAYWQPRSAQPSQLPAQLQPTPPPVYMQTQVPQQVPQQAPQQQVPQ